MATLQRYLPMGLQNPNSNNLRKYPEAASQAFLTADLVGISGGNATAYTTGTIDTNSNLCIGMALSDATGVTTNYIGVDVFSIETVLRLPVANAGAAAGVTALAQVGASYAGYYNSTTGIWSIDITNTTRPIFKVVAWDQQYPIGEVNGTMDVQFLTGFLAFP